MISSSSKRAGRSRRAPLAALTVGLALVILPAMAWAQGVEQYEEPPAPSAGTAQSAPAPAPTPPTSTGESTAPAPAPEAAAETSTTVESLPVTGLPAVPMALAGLVMLLLGTLGLRRYSGAEKVRVDEDGPIDEAVVANAIRPRGAVAVLERVSDEAVETEPPTSFDGGPMLGDAVAAPARPEAELTEPVRAGDAGVPTYAPVGSDGHGRATPGRVAGAALVVAGALGARRRISR